MYEEIKDGDIKELVQVITELGDKIEASIDALTARIDCIYKLTICKKCGGDGCYECDGLGITKIKRYKDECIGKD